MNRATEGVGLAVALVTLALDNDPRGMADLTLTYTVDELQRALAAAVGMAAVGIAWAASIDGDDPIRLVQRLALITIERDAT